MLHILEDLSAVLEQLATYNCPIVICGDLNVHVDQIDDPYTIRFHQLLESFGYCQHVHQQIHTGGHTSDLVITGGDTVVSSVRTGDIISNHATAWADLGILH